MHKLGRQVRFSVSPFLPADGAVADSDTSGRSGGEGVSIFFELLLWLVGEVEPSTGFVVNVVDIERNVREYAVPLFAGRIRERFRQGRGIDFFELVELLRMVWGRLADKFGPAKLSELNLKLNPFRKMAINSEDCKMTYFSEKFEFAAMHKLWNDDFSPERNYEVFGKCANLTGHGHNYVVEVTVKLPAGEEGFRVGDFEEKVEGEVIALLDHKNLNKDVAEFSKSNPTVENIASFAWSRLAGKFGKAALHCVTVWETDRTCCSYYGG